MDISKPEVAAVEAVAHQTPDAVRDLNDLELSLVGGGSGDIVFV